MASFFLNPKEGSKIKGGCGSAGELTVDISVAPE